MPLRQLRTWLEQHRDRDPFDVLKDAASAEQQGYQNSPQMFEDFRRVFLTTEQGKRVFHQIMIWGGQFRSSVVPGDPYGTHTNEGQRSLAARILASVLREPKELPNKQNRR